MPRTVERISSGRPLSDTDRRLGDTIARVSDLIETTRVTFRGGLLEQIPLSDARYANESLNAALALWLLGCQCNLLVHYLSEEVRSTRTGAEFSAARSVRDLVMYPTTRIMDYPQSAFRMVMLRIVKSWTRLPVLDEDFIEYLRLVRLRMCELQCMAFERSTHTLDYPPWTKLAGEAGQKQYCRATMDMARQCELYFYHLARHIDHERCFDKAAQLCPAVWCTQDDRAHLHQWLMARVNDVFLDQWRREVVERAMMIELLPPEREVFRHSNPSANYDTKNVLKYMRSARHDQINELLLATPEKMLDREPVVAVLYELIFLLQADAASFALERFVYWVTDLPVEADGCAYPAPTFFTNLDYPVIYCPLALGRFWVVSDGTVLRCGTDILFALALWLRIALGLTRQRAAYEQLLEMRFSALRRCMLRDGYSAPVRTMTKPAASAAALPPPPTPANDAPISVLLQAILDAQQRSGHAVRLAEAAAASGPPVDTVDPAPTPTMMEF